jgi:hypothetical protein
LGNPLKNSGRKANQALLIFLSILLLAGAFLIFQLEKADFMPSLSLEENPQLAYPPPEDPPVDFISPTITPFPTSTQTPTPIVLENGWYLYKDPDNEFSFAYPPTAIVTFGKNPVDLSKNISLQFLLPGKSYQGMTLCLELNPGLLSGAEIAIKVLEESSGKIAPMEFKDTLGNIMVGGKQAVQATIPGTNTETTIIVPLGEKFMIIAPVHDTAVIKVEPEILQMFYQIVDTVQFHLENGWYLYEDKEAGFSFSYPPEVYIHTSKEGFLDFKTVHIAFEPSGLGYQGMVIELFSNPKGLPIENIVQQFYSRDNPETKPAIADIKAALNPVMVGNLSAYKSVYHPSMAEFVVFVPMHFKILCVTPVTEMGLTDFAPSSQEMFDNILATLTIKP